MAHTCHATGCQRHVPPEMFMCRGHWYSLPKSLRDRIWGTYRPGQCDDWNISQAYSDAAKECVRFIAAKEGIKPDVRVYEFLEPENMDEHIELRGGLIVRADAIALLLDLERRGHVCSIRPDGLSVTRARDLTPDDTRDIKRLRVFLLALVAYEPPPISEPA